MAAMRVQYFEGSKAGHWFVRLRDGVNGEILMVSELYGKKGNAKRAAEKLGDRIPDSIVEEDKKD